MVIQKHQINTLKQFLREKEGNYYEKKVSLNNWNEIWQNVKISQQSLTISLEQPASKKEGKEASELDAVHRTDLHKVQKPKKKKYSIWERLEINKVSGKNNIPSEKDWK